MAPQQLHTCRHLQSPVDATCIGTASPVDNAVASADAHSAPNEEQQSLSATAMASLQLLPATANSVAAVPATIAQPAPAAPTDAAAESPGSSSSLRWTSEFPVPQTAAAPLQPTSHSASAADQAGTPAAAAAPAATMAPRSRSSVPNVSLEPLPAGRQPAQQPHIPAASSFATAAPEATAAVPEAAGDAEGPDIAEEPVIPSSMPPAGDAAISGPQPEARQGLAINPAHQQQRHQTSKVPAAAAEAATVPKPVVSLPANDSSGAATAAAGGLATLDSPALPAAALRASREAPADTQAQTGTGFVQQMGSCSVAVPPARAATPAVQQLDGRQSPATQQQGGRPPPPVPASQATTRPMAVMHSPRRSKLLAAQPSGKPSERLAPPRNWSTCPAGSRSAPTPAGATTNTGRIAVSSPMRQNRLAPPRQAPVPTQVAVARAALDEELVPQTQPVQMLMSLRTPATGAAGSGGASAPRPRPLLPAQSLPPRSHQPQLHQSAPQAQKSLLSTLNVDAPAPLQPHTAAGEVPAVIGGNAIGQLPFQIPQLHLADQPHQVKTALLPIVTALHILFLYSAARLVNLGRQTYT